MYMQVHVQHYTHYSAILAIPTSWDHDNQEFFIFLNSHRKSYISKHIEGSNLITGDQIIKIAMYMYCTCFDSRVLFQGTGMG